MNKDRSAQIISILRKTYSNTKPDLNFENIYQLTVAVVLSAQTTDRQVNEATPELFKKYPDFPALAEAPIEDVEKLVKSTGFYRNKARNIIKLSQQIRDFHNNVVPNKMEELIKIAGIGRKTANVILSVGYDIPGLAVDTHVARISQRLGYTEQKSPEKIEKDLCDIIPQKEWKIAHILFIRHGRDRCKARNPLCEKCPLGSFCLYIKDSA